MERLTHKMFQIKICKYAYSFSQNHVMMVHHITLKGMNKYKFQNSRGTDPHAITAAVL